MSALPIVEAILSAAAPVTSITGNRIFYSVAPQGAARPYAVIIGTGESDEPMLAGMAQYPEASISIALYADDFPALETLGDAVITALQDAQGTYRGKETAVMRDSVDRHDFLPADRVHRRIVGFRVRYR